MLSYCAHWLISSIGWWKHTISLDCCPNYECVFIRMIGRRNNFIMNSNDLWLRCWKRTCPLDCWPDQIIIEMLEMKLWPNQTESLYLSRRLLSWWKRTFTLDCRPNQTNSRPIQETLSTGQSLLEREGKRIIWSANEQGCKFAVAIRCFETHLVRRWKHTFMLDF